MQSIANTLAEFYNAAPFWSVPEETAQQLMRETMLAFNRIPVDVRFTHGNEPYNNRSEMDCDLYRQGLFRVKWRPAVEHVLGPVHMHFRAVHDWYGHYVAGNDFGLEGEIACFKLHQRSGLFSARTLPIVWSEIVLENAYYTDRGEWYPYYKPVFDTQMGVIER